jgi:hypothetical protein
MDNSTRSGKNTKQGQKYQNTFAFKHNKNSMLTRKIRETPLDVLCKRCVEKLEWRINYRKYKPLSAPSRCNKCLLKNVYKAYRTICDNCATIHKMCAKCAETVDDYAAPKNWRNDPSKKKKEDDPLFEIMKELKVRHRRTVRRKLDEGLPLIYDENKGIINEETGEVIIDIKIITNPENDIGNDDENDVEEEEKEEEATNNEEGKDDSDEEDKDS